LLRLPRQFDQADRRCHGRVLEDVEKFRGQRRNDETEGHRQHDVPVGLRQRQAQRQRSVLLAARQRIDAGAHLLADTGAGEQAETQRRREELLRQRVHLLERIAHLARQQFGQHEVPEEELHQQRDVAEGLDVGGGERRQPAVGDGAQHAEQRSGRQRDQPRGQRQRDGPLQAGEQPADIGRVA